MKTILTFSFCLLLSFSVIAQSENVGIGTLTPDLSAVLDITSTDKGVFLPRMDSTQRKNIINPKDGLIVYDSTTYSFWFFRITEWKEFNWEPGDDLGDHLATQDLDLDGQSIINLGSPNDASDGTNKSYVDGLISNVQTGVNNNASDITTNTLNINNNAANIANNTLAINTHNTNDTDLSPTNEIQTLSRIGQDLSISGGNTIALPVSTGAFENNSGVIRNTGSTSDDFVFGGTQLPPNGVNASDTLFFFDKSKAAFRFGTLDNSANWSADSIGIGSVAFGFNSLAIGDVAIAMGNLTKARGLLSFAQGSGTIANAQHSIAMGYQSQALGNSAIALGNSNIAKGNESFVVGLYSEANGASSTAIGKFAISDAFGSMAIGSFNEGGGDSSNWVLTDPIFEVGIGQDAMNKKNALTILKDGTISFRKYEFPNIDGIANQIITTDGSGHLSWADETPVVFENVSGLVRNTGSNTDDFVFGATALPPTGSQISGTLFFFDDSKGAFRAGELDNSENWSPDSIGLRSVAFGFNTVASGGNSTASGAGTEASGGNSTAMGLNTNATGLNSTAMGFATEAIGGNSTAMGFGTKAIGNVSTAIGFSTNATGFISLAMGQYTIASGDNSIAMGEFSEALGQGSTAFGYDTNANGNYSTSMGFGTKASGFYSVAIGSNTKAYSNNSFAIGRYNIGGGDSLSWFSTDPLFEIGIGTVNAAANALTIYKNGVAEFSDSLHTDGNVNIGTGIGSRLYLGNTMMQSGGSSILRMDTNIRPFADDTYDLGSTGKRWDNIYATNTVIQTSDRRLKKNITTLSHGLESVLEMNPVQYHWNKESNADKQHLGLIAQELLELIPEAVNQPENEDEYLGVKYAELVPVLIKAIQEQNDIINSQEHAISKVQNDLAELQAMVSALADAKHDILKKDNQFNK
jgi:hypothetical protein